MFWIYLLICILLVFLVPSIRHFLFGTIFYTIVLIILLSIFGPIAILIFITLLILVAIGKD